MDFEKGHPPVTVGTGGYTFGSLYTLPTGAGPAKWEIWPALCHRHSGTCHWGPYQWKSMILTVN